jgi:hypothetical protein
MDSQSASVMSSIIGKRLLGFGKKGPLTEDAAFFKSVMTGELTTNKTLLHMYYNMADLQWRGEGYGLAYYPRTKQSKPLGVYMKKYGAGFSMDQEFESIRLPKPLLKQMDKINEYEKIVTDDLFVLHASIALKKLVTFYAPRLPHHRLEFFGRGHQNQMDD